MSWREISAKQFNALKNAFIVDVRSPCEHRQESVPGSHNVPLLDDGERAIVGTIYKEQGEMTARRHALSLIAPKISPIVEEILAGRQHGQAVAIYCWRGGLRSEAVASVLSIAGIDCFRLTGGYKAWRRQVLDDFAEDSYNLAPLVLHGQTGVGKTEVLENLGKAGCQVLDLEELANHRGSVFGGLGLGEQPSQKNFDAALWTRLRELTPGAVFMEAESRKIGKIALPDCVFNLIQTGTAILITGSLEARAQRITNEYLTKSSDRQADLSEALSLLLRLANEHRNQPETAQEKAAFDTRARLGAAKVSELKALVEAGSIVEAVKILLTDYYDPLYNRQIERARPFVLELSGDAPDEAAKSIVSWIAANKPEMAAKVPKIGQEKLNPV